MATKKKTPAKKPKEPKSGPAAAKSDVKVEHFTQNARCELTEHEIVEKSKRVSRLLSTKALKHEEIKSATAHLKANVKQIDAEISKLSQEINDGAEHRDVAHERRFVYRTGNVEEWRMDTVAKTYERPMTGSERQKELDLKERAEKRAAKKAADAKAPEGEAKPANETEEAPGQPGTDEPPESGEQGDDESQEQTGE